MSGGLPARRPSVCSPPPQHGGRDGGTEERSAREQRASVADFVAAMLCNSASSRTTIPCGDFCASRELHIDILFCLVVQNFTFFHVFFEVLFVLFALCFCGLSSCPVL